MKGASMLVGLFGMLIGIATRTVPLVLVGIALILLGAWINRE